MAEQTRVPEKDVDEILRILGQASIFKGLSLESLRSISSKIQTTSFAKDYSLIEEGRPGIRLYLVKTGSARVVIGTEKYGGEFTVATINSGECFGEMSLLTGGPCCATVKANENSSFCYLTKSDFDNIISEDPLIHQHFNNLLVKRLRMQNIKSMHIKEHEIALNKYLQNIKEYEYSRVIGKSNSITKVLQEAGNLSKISDPIIIVGESGTGKELLARKIHSDSALADYPVIEIALPKERRLVEIEVHNERRKRDTVECELFGSEKVDLLKESGTRIGLLELANEGTLIIKNIENMFPHIQQSFLKFLRTGTFTKVGAYGPIYSNVRIIVTTKDINLAKKQLGPGLFGLLATHMLEVPPLCKRKKDIPYLIEHFVDKISRTKGTRAKKFSKEATNKLLKHDYSGNVNELKNVIERAVELSRENTIIAEEEIFLGDIDTEDKTRFNLLKISLIETFCRSSKMLLAAKTIAMFSFFSILYFLLVQPGVSIGGRSFALILSWQICLPLMFIIFLFAARFGCGICPFSSVSKFLSKHFYLRLPTPSFIKKYDLLIMGTGFITILFIEKYTQMAHSVTKTASLILSIFFLTIIFDFVFEKSAWCRHLCPLGGLGGIFGMSSMTEIRANKNVCTTICTTHDCYKGSKEVDRCPMYLHLQFLSDNKNCKFCFNCIRNCKYNAIRLNLRIPGAEIGSLKGPSLVGALLSIILCGLMLAEIPSKQVIGQSGFPFIFCISILFSLSLCAIGSYFTASFSTKATLEHLKSFGYTLLPLTLCGFIAFQFLEVFRVEDARGSLMLFGVYKYNFYFTNIIQLFLLAIGFLITVYLVSKVVKNTIEKEKQFRTFAIQGTIPLIFITLHIWLFYNGIDIF